MPSFCVLGLCGYIAFFLTLQVTYALTLDIPSEIIVGETVNVSWTSVPDNLNTMNLDLLCGNGPSAWLRTVASPVSTAPTNFMQVLVPPPPDSLNFGFPNNSLVFAQVQVTLDAASTSTTTPKPPVTSTGRPLSASTDTSEHLESGNPITSFPSNTITSTSESTPISTTPIGAIVGSVVGGLVGLGILTILFIIWLRRRRPPPLQRLPAPVPLPYDPNYVQPLDKTSQPACTIINEKEAAERQRDQLQTEVESMHLRESARNGPSGITGTPSGSGPPEQLIEVLRQRILELETQQPEQLIEALRQRILELETQQRNLEHQPLPPSYFDSTSSP
ncbi:hypothetical protein C0995_003346 [Termitomyces sp. Mi166|nr:hypothetical protein C0995_012271 [Termitomyces sp. Mi166\